MVRCKFRCTFVGQQEGWTSVKQDDGSFKSVWRPLYSAKFSPVYSDKPDSENKRFWDATPSGSFEVQTVKDMPWTVGKEYYFDIAEAP